jgi:hypothetical protein
MQLTFFSVHALLVPRLVRKRYRSFRVAVLRDDGSSDRKLALHEVAPVAIQVVLPHVLFVLGASLFLFVWQSAHLNNEAAHGIESLLFIGRIFVVGPYAVHFALRGPYNGFRLQAYGQRFI